MILWLLCLCLSVGGVFIFVKIIRKIRVRVGLLVLALSCHINHVCFDIDMTLCDVSLGSIYVKYSYFRTKGKIVTLTNITHVDYVK
jgi:hypothetical protein